MPMRRNPSAPRFQPTLSFVLLAFFVLVIAFAGGASRGDVPGQALVRATAVGTLAISALSFKTATIREIWPILAFVVAALLLALLQLVPLPPGVWQSLPGRSLFTDPALDRIAPGAWRPLSLAPGATINAAFSLVVPLAAALLVADIGATGRARLPTMLLTLVGMVTLVGLLQTSGAGFHNPLVNGTPGQISGTFANRNHFALLLALGCLMAPAWAFSARNPARWHVPFAFGVMALFFLTIMVSGSRAGMALGIIAFILGPLIVLKDIRRLMDRQPKWVLPAIAIGVVLFVATLVLISFATSRSVSLDRLLIGDTPNDIRSRGRPIVLAMIGTYFPVGSGIGGFDPVFRIHEPFSLLKPTYFNHAHNDWLEIVLDAGMPGAVLMVCAVAWWAISSTKILKSDGRASNTLPKLGSASILLIFMASAVDYPARTPLIMLVLVVSAAWLNDGVHSGAHAHAASALPDAGQHL